MSRSKALPAEARAQLSTDSSSLRSTLRTIGPFVAPYRARIVVVGIASVIAGFAEAAVLVLVVQVAVALSDGTGTAEIGTGPLPISLELTIPQLLLAAVGISVVRFGLQSATAIVPARLCSEALTRLRQEVHELYLASSWDEQSRDREGHLQELVVTQINRAGQAVFLAVVGLAAVLDLLALGLSAVLVNPVAALSIAVMVAVLFVALRPLSAIVRRESETRADTSLGLASAVSETVRLTEEITVFGVGDRQRTTLDAIAERDGTTWRKVVTLQRLTPTIYQNLAIVLLLAALGGLYALGAEHLASLGAVVLILVRAMSYGQTAQGTFQSMSEMLPYLDLVRAAQDRYRAARLPTGDEPLEHIRTLEVRDVAFAYVPGTPVLRDVSAAFHPGEAVGIVGPSGAGKSTFVQVLLRLRPPSEGRYLVNDLDALDYDEATWRRRVAFVPQDSRLLTGTVADNIRFLRDGISDDDVVRAARMAHIHDEVTGWRDGYDTVIGQRADAVSGGQRQRICIARALVTRPDVLVLDEPTSALDVRSEAKVQEALQELKGDVTLFIIAHRLSTLSICDRVMVFQDGRLEDFASRERLLQLNEFYRQASDLSEQR